MFVVGEYECGFDGVAILRGLAVLRAGRGAGVVLHSEFLPAGGLLGRGVDTDSRTAVSAIDQSQQIKLRGGSVQGTEHMAASCGQAVDYARIDIRDPHWESSRRGQSWDIAVGLAGLVGVPGIDLLTLDHSIPPHIGSWPGACATVRFRWLPMLSAYSSSTATMTSSSSDAATSRPTATRRPGSSVHGLGLRALAELVSGLFQDRLSEFRFAEEEVARSGESPRLCWGEQVERCVGLADPLESGVSVLSVRSQSLCWPSIA